MLILLLLLPLLVLASLLTAADYHLPQLAAAGEYPDSYPDVLTGFVGLLACFWLSGQKSGRFVRIAKSGRHTTETRTFHLTTRRANVPGTCQTCQTNFGPGERQMAHKRLKRLIPSAPPRQPPQPTSAASPNASEANHLTPAT